MMLKKMMLTICLAAVYTTHYAHATYVGFANILEEGSLTNTISIEYKNYNNQHMIFCFYNNICSAYSIDTKKSDPKCKQLAGKYNTFTAQSRLEEYSNVYLLYAINPTGKQSEATVYFDDTVDNPAIIQFNPPNYQNGVMISNQSIHNGGCVGHNKQFWAGIDQWLPCVTNTGDP